MMNMRIQIIVLILVVPEYLFLSGECPNLKTNGKLIRKRRYVAFPDGTDVVIEAELVKTFLTHVPSGWYMTLDLDAIFRLPDKEFISATLRKKLHHKQKRELWDRVKNTLNLRNMNGHACVLRSICDAKMYLAPPGKSLVHDLLRVMFTAPLEEKDFKEEVGDVYRELSNPDFCDHVQDCPFSLVHFILNFNKKRK